MKLKGELGLWLTAIVLCCGSISSAVGQVAISDAIVSLDARDLSWRSHKVLWFHSDGTYETLLSESFGVMRWETGPRDSGNYRYSTTDSTHALLELTSDLAPVATDWTSLPLTFTSANAGVTDSGFTSFEISPRVAGGGFYNVSNRALITTQVSAITGFSVQAESGQWVLVRAVGGSLASFGVEDAVGATMLDLRRASDGQDFNVWTPVWDDSVNRKAQFIALFDMAGAFHLEAGKGERAVFVHLPKGNYTVKASSPDASGEVLTEAYGLPY